MNIPGMREAGTTIEVADTEPPAATISSWA